MGQNYGRVVSGGAGGTDTVARSSALAAQNAINEISAPAGDVVPQDQYTWQVGLLWKAEGGDRTIPATVNAANLGAAGFAEADLTSPVLVDEIVFFGADPTGAVPAGAKFSVNTVSGDRFYDDGGTWKAFPIDHALRTDIRDAATAVDDQGVSEKAIRDELDAKQVDKATPVDIAARTADKFLSAEHVGTDTDLNDTGTIAHTGVVKGYIDRLIPYLTSEGWQRSGGGIKDGGGLSFDQGEATYIRVSPTGEVQTFTHAAATAMPFRVVGPSGFITAGLDGSDLTVDQTALDQDWGFYLDGAGSLLSIKDYNTDNDDGAEYRFYQDPLTGDRAVKLPYFVETDVDNTVNFNATRNQSAPAAIDGWVYIGSAILGEDANSIAYIINGDDAETSAASTPTPTAAGFRYFTTKALAEAAGGYSDGEVIGYGITGSYKEYRILSAGADWATSTKQRVWPQSISSVGTDTNYDWWAQVTAENIPPSIHTHIVNTSPTGGIDIIIDPAHTITYVRHGKEISTPPNSGSLDLGPLQACNVWYVGNQTFFELMSSSYKGPVTATQLAALNHNGLNLGDFAFVGPQLWVYDDNSTLPDSATVISPDDVVSTGRWLTSAEAETTTAAVNWEPNTAVPQDETRIAIAPSNVPAPYTVGLPYEIKADSNRPDTVAAMDLTEWGEWTVVGQHTVRGGTARIIDSVSATPYGMTSYTLQDTIESNDWIVTQDGVGSVFTWFGVSINDFKLIDKTDGLVTTSSLTGPNRTLSFSGPVRFVHTTLGADHTVVVVPLEASAGAGDASLNVLESVLNIAQADFSNSAVHVGDNSFRDAHAFQLQIGDRVTLLTTQGSVTGIIDADGASTTGQNLKPFAGTKRVGIRQSGANIQLRSVDDTGFTVIHMQIDRVSALAKSIIEPNTVEIDTTGAVVGDSFVWNGAKLIKSSGASVAREFAGFFSLNGANQYFIPSVTGTYDLKEQLVNATNNALLTVIRRKSNGTAAYTSFNNRISNANQTNTATVNLIAGVTYEIDPASGGGTTTGSHSLEMVLRT